MAMSPRLLRLALTALVLALVASLAPNATAASKKTAVAVGIGDQSPAMFSTSAFKKLKIRKTRYFIPWNAYSDKEQRQRADDFVNAARKAKVRVLMHISTDNFEAKKAKLPSVKQYRKDVGKLVRRYKRKGVKDWGAWNEANHKTQPTYRSPKRAAQFFVEMRRLCKGCTIVGLDVLDQRGVEKYIRSFYRAVPRSQRRFVKVVGIHNYSDVNRNRTKGTRSIIKEVKKRDNVKTQFWLTETGGLVSFGRSFKCDEERAAQRTKSMFSLVKRYRRDIKRLYTYNWQGTDCTEGSFDAGLVRLDGSTRPAYDVFLKEARRFQR